METEEIIWQLPVKQSNKTDRDWIHPRANYHAFRENKSLCGKYSQQADFFETNMPEGNQERRCKVCLKRSVSQYEGMVENEAQSFVSLGGEND